MVISTTVSAVKPIFVRDLVMNCWFIDVVLRCSEWTDLVTLCGERCARSSIFPKSGGAKTSGD
jgi:hypothetical protein